MTEAIMEIVVGVVIIVVGILNAMGNVSMLHSYHRKRVKEEDILPFGRRVGSGTIIIGLTIIVAGITDLLSMNIADIIMIIGLVPGIILIVYAMRKYNNGVF